MNKTTIILVNYKNFEDTVECLDSLQNLDFKNFDIIIIEVCNLNNSVENLEKYISNSNFKINLIKLNENKGFAFANNQALKYALKYSDNEFFWILNNDTVVKKDTLSELIKFYNKNIQNEKIGFIGSKILHYQNPEIIQTIGGTFNPNTGISKLITTYQTEYSNQNQHFIKPDYVIGASMFFHKKLIEKLDLMPEEYFLYYEDIDWCFTALKNGLINYTCLDSIVLHKQGSSTNLKYGKTKSKISIKKYMYSSYLIFFKKHFPHKIFIAYLMLLKQFFGKLLRLNIIEAKFILNVILKSK